MSDQMSDFTVCGVPYDSRVGSVAITLSLVTVHPDKFQSGRQLTNYKFSGFNPHFCKDFFTFSTFSTVSV